MAGTYSDNQITALLQERKPLSVDWRARIRLRPKRDTRNATWSSGAMPEASSA